MIPAALAGLATKTQAVVKAIEFLYWTARAVYELAAYWRATGEQDKTESIKDLAQSTKAARKSDDQCHVMKCSAAKAFGIEKTHIEHAQRDNNRNSGKGAD